MRWIKASERLPEMEKPLYLKIDGATMGLGNFYEQDQCYFVFVQRNSAHEEFEKLWYRQLNVEWLDESESTPSEFFKGHFSTF